MIPEDQSQSQHCQTLIEKFVNDRDETVVSQLGQRI